MGPRTLGQVCSDLAEVLQNFNGREYSGDLTPGTLFFGDLGLTSIDAVVLAEALEERYGRKFPFGTFLANKAKEGARDLSLGALAEFLHEHLGPPALR